ncbi:MAG TPA: MalY/PatB family protein [Anaerolineales bacterium]|nr:MalY/PatB family protein [Anaerolineales bacterium]
MTYSFDRAPDRRSPDRVNKWTWYPPDVLPLWVADMDFRAPPPVLAALRRAVDEGVLGYELPSKALSETVAGRMQRLYGWSVDPSSVVAVTGIVSGFNVAARAFGASRKKGYLIQPPVYNEFHSVQANTGIKEYEAPLLERAKGNILRYEIDWDAFEKQVSKARVFILCNPHNPIGQIYSRRDLRRMAEMCLENDVVIISDEIHSELLLGGQKFTPIAAQSKAIAQQTITLVSPSKTFNVPGLFCGFAIISNPDLRAQYARVVDQLRLHVSSMGLFAARTAFSGECDDWLHELLAYLTANRDFVVDYAREYLPDVRLTKPDATYLAWLDCRELVRQGRITGTPYEFFLNEAKVAFGEGRIYGESSRGYVRLNFGCTRRTLKQALDRVRDSLYRRKRG